MKIEFKIAKLKRGKAFLGYFLHRSYEPYANELSYEVKELLTERKRNAKLKSK